MVWYVLIDTGAFVTPKVTNKSIKVIVSPQGALKII